MCDNHSLDDMAAEQQRRNVSRRGFGALSTAAGLLAALPRAAHAVDVKENDVIIKTPDGEAETYFVHPTSGKAPAILMWADAFGLRPALRQMGKRLAEEGYAVFVPNPFYRTGKLPVMPEGLNFQNPDDRAIIMKHMGALNATTHVTDAKAFVSFIDAQAPVDTAKKMGTTGYCMGGPITMRTAAEHPDRVGAAASFHGGGLVTDQPNSPHLLLPKIKASYLFAIAQNDDAQRPTDKDVLREACAKAGVQAEIEVYPAMHGWCPPDAAVYDQVQAEKAWGRMLAIFKPVLQPRGA